MEYYIVGADGKEYGPVNEEDLRSWIDQGRAKETTLCRKGKDGDWKPPCKIINIGANFETPHPVQNTVQESNSEVVWDYITLRNHLLQRDAKISIGKYISKGWQLMNKRMGLLRCHHSSMAPCSGGERGCDSCIWTNHGRTLWIYLCVLRDQNTTLKICLRGLAILQETIPSLLVPSFIATGGPSGLILGILAFVLTYALFGTAYGDYNQTIPWYWRRNWQL